MPTTDTKRLAAGRAWREARGLRELLTTEETAARLGVSESLLKHGRLSGRGDLPQPVRVSNRVLYRRVDVDRWANARAQGAPYRPTKGQA